MSAVDTPVFLWELVEGLDQSWRVEAACEGADNQVFFPGKGEGGRKAKAICVKCVVRPECLEYAMKTNQPFGIWGGMSERERRLLRRERLKQFA